MKQDLGRNAARRLLTTNLLLLAAALAGRTQKAAAADFPTTCQAIGCNGGNYTCNSYCWDCDPNDGCAGCEICFMN